MKNASTVVIHGDELNCDNYYFEYCSMKNAVPHKTEESVTFFTLPKETILSLGKLVEFSEELLKKNIDEVDREKLNKLLEEIGE